MRVTIDAVQGHATIDFTGTSEQRPTNFNAPLAVTRAAVLYVLRLLVDEAVPLNEGFLRPVRIIVPEGSMLHPRSPAAVVAGSRYFARSMVGVAPRNAPHLHVYAVDLARGPQGQWPGLLPAAS